MTGVERVRGSRLDLRQHLQAVDLRHVQVEQHDAWIARRALRVHALAEHEVQRRLAVLHPHDLLADAADLQRADGQLRVGGVVVGQQDVAAQAHRSLLMLMMNPYSRATSRSRSYLPDLPPCPASKLTCSSSGWLPLFASRSLAIHLAGS